MKQAVGGGGVLQEGNGLRHREGRHIAR